MIQVNVDVYSESKHDLPYYKHQYDSGMDVQANLTEPVVIRPGDSAIIPTGLFVAIPPGYELQVRPRSGTSYKTKLRIPNTTGTIDAPYRGEIGIIVENTGANALSIENGVPVAQLVLAPVIQCVWNRVPSKDSLPETSRGEGGFGSTDNAKS